MVDAVSDNPKAAEALDRLFAALELHEQQFNEMMGDFGKEIEEHSRQYLLDGLRKYGVTPTDDVLIGIACVLDLLENQANAPFGMMPYGFVMGGLKIGTLTLMKRLREERIG